MSWSLGYDTNWNRDIGYSVPAYCDHPDCTNVIDRGLSFVCGGQPYGGGDGCGLCFCENHMQKTMGLSLCERCNDEEKPFPAKTDHPDWIKHKATDPSWEAWRLEQQKLSAT